MDLAAPSSLSVGVVIDENNIFSIIAKSSAANISLFAQIYLRILEFIDVSQEVIIKWLRSTSMSFTKGFILF
jgi:hypothetical protein